MSACPACREQTPEGARFCPSCGTPLGGAGHPAAERKVVTTLFADLVDFTGLGERQDPEDVDAALRAFYDLARGVIGRFGGAVEKFIGDAVVGLFGVPLAHEDDAERAVRAALEILRHIGEVPPAGGERLRVRAGVETGPALVRLRVVPLSGEGILVGDAVNTAARLLTGAPSMSVVVGAGTHRLTRRVIAYERLPDVEAKGKANRLERWMATEPVSRRGVEISGDAVPMIGREVELAMLSGLLDKAIAADSPQFALVLGEAGIGKSRLLREFFRSIDARPEMLCNWRQGHCPPYGAGLAYSTIREIVGAHAGIATGEPPDVTARKLRQSVGEDGPYEWLVDRLRPLFGLPGAPSERGENLAAWTRFVEGIARSRPAVVVIEDLHWASEPTLEFLEHFARLASGVPLLLVGTARPEFLVAHSSILERLPALTRVELKSLSHAETSRLAQALAPRSGADTLAGRVAEQCGGNPLFAEELARFLDEEGGGAQPAVGSVHDAPMSLLTLIAARLDALSPEHKQVLADASVVGPVFWPAAAAAVGETGLDDVLAGLTHLEEREFIRRHAGSSLEGEPELAFWHALVRDVAYEQLPRSSRAVRHVRAARWLESRTRAGDDFIDVIALHYATGLKLARASNDTAMVDETRAAAREALVRAGDRALRLDLAAAEEHYRLAQSTLEGDDALRPELLLKRGEAVMVVDRLERAAALQREAVGLFAAAGDTRRRAYALSRLAYTLMTTRIDEGRSLSEQAVSLLARDGPSTEAIAVLETWTTFRLWQGDLPAVLESTQHILDMAQQLGIRRPARALSMHGYVRCLLGEREGLDEMLEGIAIAEEHDSAREISGLRDAYARCLCVVEDPAAALRLVRRWIADAGRRHDQGYVTDLSVIAARYLLLCGRWGETLAMANGLLEESRHRETAVMEAELCALLVAAHVGRGTLDAAESAAHRFEDLVPEVGELRANLGTVAVAALATELGDKARAAQQLAQLVPTLDFSSEPTDILIWPWAVRTALAAGEGGLAAPLARAAFDWPSCPTRVRAGLAALLAENAADYHAASEHYAEAAAAWEAGRSPNEAGLAQLGHARCRLRLGRTEEATAALDRARDLLRPIGARLALAEVDRLLPRA
jgi:class 3 adenylate cyclase